MEKKVYKKSILDPNKFVAIIGYLVITFLLSSLVIIFLGFIIAKANNLSNSILNETLTATDLSKYPLEYIKANSLAQGYGNLIGYMLATIFVSFYMRDDLITDFRDLMNRKKYHSLYIPFSAISFCLLVLAVDFLVAKFVPVSDNQSTIESIINYGGAFPMVIATVIFAPVVEELIYRKAIFYYGKRYGTAACYIFSIIFFTLPHMLSSDVSNIGVWLLQCVPYASSAAMLCFIYHKSNYNIYTAIAAHMLNNTIAVLFTLL